MRLFAALPLPLPAIERLTSLRLRLSAPRDGLRWAAPEQWHLTLGFFGEVSDTVADNLAAEMSAVQSPAPMLTLEAFGMFPAKGILHIAVEPSEELSLLHKAVGAAGAACGLLPEARPFRPHLTMARSKGKTGDATLRRLQAAGLPPFGVPLSWRADELLLLESTLRPEGALYTVRERFPLPVAEQVS